MYNWIIDLFCRLFCSFVWANCTKIISYLINELFISERVFILVKQNSIIIIFYIKYWISSITSWQWHVTLNLITKPDWKIIFLTRIYYIIFIRFIKMELGWIFYWYDCLSLGDCGIFEFRCLEWIQMPFKKQWASRTEPQGALRKKQHIPYKATSI